MYLMGKHSEIGSGDLKVDCYNIQRVWNFGSGGSPRRYAGSVGDFFDILRSSQL